MTPHDEQATRFQETWPLLALRYALVVAAISAWLWKAGTPLPPVTPLLALLLTLMLLFELPLYGPQPGRLRPLWASLQTATASVAYVISPGLPTALVVCAVISGIAATMAREWAFGSLGLAIVAALVGLLPEPNISGTIALISGYTLALWVGRLFALRSDENRAHRRTVLQLQQAQARIARLAETSRELAAAEERQRLSAELHDTLGHALVATLLQVQVTRRLVDAGRPHEATSRLDLIEQSIKDTLGQVRRSLRRGRHAGEPLSLSDALESLVADFRAAEGPDVELSFQPDAKATAGLVHDVAEALYRTAQEALTNAVRHGKARRVQISVRVEGPRLRLRIKDDGVGADHYIHGMGLTGMVSRVQSVGGSLRFSSTAGEGFQVEVAVKIR